MTQTNRGAGYWLRRRVRVWSGNPGGKVVLAEGVVLGYSPAPTIMIRDAQGRDSHWQVTLPIDTLDEEISDQELREVILAGDRWRAPETPDTQTTMQSPPAGPNDELISALAEVIAHPGSVLPRGGMFTESGARWTARAVVASLPRFGEIRPAVDQAELDQILRDAGIEYPLGLRGVRDLVAQRDGHLEALREAEAELTELRAMKARLDEKRDSLALDYTSENNRLVDMLDGITGDL